MDKHQFKLIEGNFSTDEAKKVLMSVINSKINYHNLNAFSDFVRNNENESNTKTRVSELVASREGIIKIIEEAEAKEMKLNIKSNIIIELI